MVEDVPAADGTDDAVLRQHVDADVAQAKVAARHQQDAARPVAAHDAQLLVALALQLLLQQRLLLQQKTRRNGDP